MTFYDRLIRALLLRRRHSSGLRTEESRRAFLRTIVLGGATLPFAPGALERIVLSSGPSHGKLIPIISREDYARVMAAHKAFADFIAPTILQVVDQAPIITNLWDEYPSYQEASGTVPIIPLDFTWGIPDPGNLPRSEIIASR